VGAGIPNTISDKPPLFRKRSRRLNLNSLIGWSSRG
jgi:hypothetical protein